MEQSELCISTAETEALKREVAELKRTLVKMSEASIGISENVGTEPVLQEVVNSA